MAFFITVIGMVMIVEGLPYFAFPEGIKSWLKKIGDMPAGELRRLGFVLMVAGLGLVYWGKQLGT